MNMILAGGSVGDNLADALLPEKIRVLGIEIGPSLVSAFIISIILIVFALILRFTVIKNLKRTPSKIQMMLEGLVSFFAKQAKDTTHHFANGVAPFTMACSIFIFFSTMAELVGLRPAMADINACFAFGLAAFFIINYYGFKQKKLNRLKRFCNPINIITDLAVPVSLSFRLFGSIVSGLLITELIYSFLFTSFVIPAGVAVITTIFHALIQSYVFATLTSLFIGEAIE